MRNGFIRVRSVFNPWLRIPLCVLCASCGNDSGSGFPGLDFDLVGVRVELGTEAEGFAL
jgi:hypothetical protein